MSPRPASITPTDDSAVFACGCSVERDGRPGTICDAHRVELDRVVDAARAGFFAQLDASLVKPVTFYVMREVEGEECLLRQWQGLDCARIYVREWHRREPGASLSIWKNDGTLIDAPRQAAGYQS